jgi:hypothetical protein
MSSSDLAIVCAITEREQRLIRSGTHYAHGVTAMPDKMGALRAVVRALTSAEIPHALIGGLAVGIRSGVPRATLDVDIAVSTAVDRATVTSVVLSERFTLVGQFAHSINFKHESGEPLQLAFDPAFDAMIARAELLTFDEFAIPVVTKDDLIAMKRRAAADPKRRRSKALRDQADIALLEGDVPDPDEGW